MQLIKTTAIWLAIFPLSLAATCTSSGALSWPPQNYNGGSSGGSGGSSGSNSDACSPTGSAVECCKSVSGNDPTAFQACLRMAGIKRATTLDCTSSETCYQYVDGSLLCLDRSNGLYHDDVGGHGNYNTGEYTSPDGQVTTDLVGAGSTKTSTAAQTTRSASSARSASTTGTGTAAAATTSATASPSAAASSGSRTGSLTAASATTSAAAATSSTAGSGAERLGAGAGVVIGAVGLAVRLVL